MAFHGRQPRGAGREHRTILREEAEARNAKTPPERRRRARLAAAAEAKSAR